MGERLRVAVALVCLVVACGRTELDDLGPGPYDAAPSTDASIGEGATGRPDGSGEDSSRVVGPDGSSDAGMDAVSTNDSAATGDGGAPGCNPTTCPVTCCLPDGTCVPAISNEACGSGGRACAVCGPTQFCKGDCIQAQDNCGPSNCPGCCDNEGYCATGDSNYACGHSGEACERCVPAEGTGSCIPLGDAGGTCEALTTCSPADCSGCCSGKVCLVGDQNDACGTDGVACALCGGQDACTFDATGQYGAKNHYVCAPVSPCGPSTCTGCCDGLVCAEGNQDVACGAGGATCANCQAASRSCTQGVCR